MNVEFISSEKINSDLGVVNSARVSLTKHHEKFVESEDDKLIQFLSRQNHISPFFHPRLYFGLHFEDLKSQLHFFKNINHSGFVHLETEPHFIYFKGSLFSWINNAQPHCMTEDMGAYIFDILEDKFPVSCKAFEHLRIRYNGYYPYSAVDYTEEEIKSMSFNDPRLYKLLSATLRVKVPIFVARQIRTSKVGMAYSDLYVEAESFDFNEVSRRYVNDEPEFYQINEWRVREGGKVKQGSTGLASEELDNKWKEKQRLLELVSANTYSFSQHDMIAPEQARAMLPQSMYTEFFMTATLHRWSQFLKLRIDPHVQFETQEIAIMIRDCLKKEFPHWNEFYKL